LRNNALSSGASVFQSNFTRLILSARFPKSVKQLLSVLRAPEAPPTPDLSCISLVFLCVAARFHSAPELLLALWSVLTEPGLSHEPIHPEPGRTMFPSGRIPREAAPGITLKQILWFQKTGANWVQVDIVANGFQVTIPAAIDQKGLVPSTQYVSITFMPVVEPDGIGALKPSHSFYQIRFGVSAETPLMRDLFHLMVERS
jgi:hypothetical protein